MDRLRFLHIPKTAGTTFVDILIRQYGYKTVFPFTGNIPHDVERYNALDSREKRSVRLFIGHSPMITGIEDADRSTIITFLREPVSRVKSYCQHVSEGKSEYLREFFPPENFDLDLFLESGNDELSNLQTKMLINNGDCASSCSIDRMSSSDAGELALHNLLNEVSIYGLQEFFDESLILLSSHLDWPLPFYTSQNLKKSNRLLDFTEHHLRKIEDLNRIDIQLYEAAKEKFIHTLYSRKFDHHKFKKFKFYHPIVQPYLKTHSFIEKLNRRFFRPLFPAWPS